MGFDSLVGQTLGQYELRALLGAGGMGAVYRGFQAGLRREVAVKVLPSILAQDSNYIARFNREAEISASLENAHIVPVYDYGTQNGISYVVMRLLSGGSLADRLRVAEQQKLPLPSLTEISSMLRQLAGALDYAHNRGVIHRDLKPGNIMFDNQGDAFLVDFGIAKLLKATTSLTGTGMGVGTPSFMPPEQWRSEELTPAADQYALAIVIYMMLTGHMPFEADTPFQAMHKHLNEPPTPAQVYRADVPQSVSLVLDRALSKESASRFPTVTAFAQAFDSAITGFESTTTGFFTSPVLPRTPTARPTVAHTPAARMPTAPITSDVATSTGNQPTAAPRRGPMILIGSVVVLIVVAAIGFAVLQTLNSHASEQNFNATLTGIALAAVPSATPTTALTSTTAATEAIVAAPTDSATPTLTDTQAPSATPTETLSPTLSGAQMSATAVLTVSEAAKQTQVAAVDITARALMMANQTAAAQIQQTQTALAASPTPSATPTATSTATSTVTPSPTQTPVASATPKATNTVAPTLTPTQTAHPTETPTITATQRGIRVPTATPKPEFQVVVPQGASVVIGLAASLGGSTADYGIDARRAVELALKNRPSVLVNGKTFPVTLDVRDDQCNSIGGQFIANTFIANDRVVGVVGPTCASGCQAAAPILDAAHFTSISPSCTASEMTVSGYSSFNRTVSPDSAQGKAAAEYIYHTLHITRIATVADASLYSQGLVDAVTKAFVALGGRVVGATSSDVSTTNFRRTIQNLVARDPQLIYFGGSAYQIESWAQRNDVPQMTVPLMVFDRLDYAQATTFSSKGAKGMYVLAALQLSDAKTTRFLQQYSSAYGEEPPAPYHAEAYDAANILLDAITYTGSVDATGTLIIDREKLAAYVRSVRDTTGLTGTLTANGKGELATSPIGIFQESSGKLTQVAVGEIDVATGVVTVGEPG